MKTQDNEYMQLAVREARKAGLKNEVPIGAVMVNKQGEVIGRGYNQTHMKKDGLQHAELAAIRQAQKRVGDWRLEDTILYVTVEPCLMCLGAIGNARIKKMVYVLADPVFGSAESKLTKRQVGKLFPKLVCQKMKDDGTVAGLMKGFFKDLRAK